MSLPTLLLTGCDGQLGIAFHDYWQDSILADSYKLVRAGKDTLDISNVNEVIGYLTEVRPRVIVNAAAYTKVDDAETDIESAYKVNEKGVENLVSWCEINSCKLIHISTDFVFDGKASSPYQTDAHTNPICVYGASKLSGERHVLRRLPSKGFVVRTSWLYSEYGHNFVKTMLRLMSDARDVRVISDQVGSPTSVHSLCGFIAELIRAENRPGIYHFTDDGEVSWYEFAVAIKDLAIEAGLLPRQPKIISVTSAEFPTAARRPAYSVLDVSVLKPGTKRRRDGWRTELLNVLERIKASPFK